MTPQPGKPAEAAAAIREANERSVRSTVVAMRRIAPDKTLQEIADAVGLSKQRVQQIVTEELGQEATG